jgi:hypothetical protein
MNVHSIPPKVLIARHNQLLRSKSNGQPLERSQVTHLPTQKIWAPRVTSGKRRCGWEEFWLHAKLPMRSVRTDRSSKVAMATGIAKSGRRLRIHGEVAASRPYWSAMRTRRHKAARSAVQIMKERVRSNTRTCDDAGAGAAAKCIGARSARVDQSWRCF